MRLGEEIFKLLGGEGETSRIGYTVIDGKGGYFQNVRRLLEFSPTRLVLKGKEGAVAVEGEALFLTKYTDGDASVSGRIRSVTRMD